MPRKSLRTKNHYSPKVLPSITTKKSVRTVHTHAFFPRKTAAEVSILHSQMQEIVERKNFPAIHSYIHSVFDKPELVSIKPVDLLKEQGGQGVFADTEIPKNTCIGAYTGVRYTEKQYKTYLSSNPNANADYAMFVGNNIIDASNSGNFSRYINYSDTQSNVEFIELPGKSGLFVSIVASRTIKKGEQLLINYNVYDSRVAKLFYFLNPQDNDLSSAQFYQLHRKLYKKKRTMPFDLPFLQLEENERLVMTSLGIDVFAGNHLSSKRSIRQVNYPYLRQEIIGQTETIVDFAKKDIFTPLMIACYLGHIQNVHFLVNHDAYIDQKQHQSGNCPLFFALQGYAEKKHKQEDFLAIMCFLIQKNANILSCDRQDKTFLHKAIAVLSTRHFQAVIDAVIQNNTINFEQILTYVDEEGFDLILTAIKGKYYGVFISLLLTTPDYFKLYQSGLKKDRLFHQSTFRRALEGYSS